MPNFYYIDLHFPKNNQTKTTMAVNIVKRLVPKFAGFDKPIEVIVDGGYAKDTVLLPLKELCNITTITRLRRDAVVFEVPPPKKKTKKFGYR